MRWTLALGLGVVLSGCTAEPVGRGLFVKSPTSSLSAPPPNLFEKAERAQHVENERAVAQAMAGHYDEALRIIGDERPVPSRRSASPPPEDPPKPIVYPAAEYLNANRRTIAYWKQRRDFAGTNAVPDTYARLETSLVHQSSAAGSAAAAAETLDVEFAGIGVRLPVVAVWQDGRSDVGMGDFQLRFTGWIGSAASMPDTKFSFGTTLQFATGADRVGGGDGYAAVFFRLGQRVGPVSLVGRTSIAPSGAPDGGTGALFRYGAAANYTSLGRLQPFVSIDFATLAGSGAGGRSAGQMSEGFRFFLDRRDDWQLALSALHFVSFTSSEARALGTLLSLQYRY